MDSPSPPAAGGGGGSLHKQQRSRLFSALAGGAKPLSTLHDAHCHHRHRPLRVSFGVSVFSLRLREARRQKGENVAAEGKLPALGGNGPSSGDVLLDPVKLLIFYRNILHS